MTEFLEPGFEVLPQPAAASHRRGKLLGSVAAVIVLAGGGAATYIAFAAGGTGSGSPKAAVQKVVADLQKSDLIGVLDDLAPGERAAYSAPMRADVSSLKRLGVLTAKANPSAVSGVHIAAHNLVYADKTITVNDHVQIVKITGGTLVASSDVAHLPFTKRILSMVDAKNGQGRADFAKHQARVAAQKVNGHWYASLFYSVADQATGHVIPSASDRVPAKGASSPDGAVRLMVRALLSGDERSALALISPAELNAVHDYGGKIIGSAPRMSSAAATITTLDLTKTAISDGGVRVGLKKLVVALQGRTLSVTIDKGCAKIATTGFNKRVCAADAVDLVDGLITGLSCVSGSSSSSSGSGVFYGPPSSSSGSGSSSSSSSSAAPAPSGSDSAGSGSSGSGSSDSGSMSSASGSMSSGSGSSAYSSQLQITTDPSTSKPSAGFVPTPQNCSGGPTPFTKAQKRALSDAFSVVSKIGVDTAKVGGSWYVTPVRTFADLGANLLAGLKGDDLFQLSTLTGR